MRTLVGTLTFLLPLSSAADFTTGVFALEDGDYALAFLEFKQSAERGHAASEYNLAVMYEQGLGVPQDDQEAKKWYIKAADRGFADAEYRIGVMHRLGEGVPKDDKEAVKWFAKAAEKYHASAQFNLGVMYDNGQGVPEDDKEAVKWYVRAASSGHAKAQFNLGVVYLENRGVPQDMVCAHMWLNIAGSNGLEDGRKARDEIASSMTPQQIAEAQARASEFVKTGSRGRC